MDLMKWWKQWRQAQRSRLSEASDEEVIRAIRSLPAHFASALTMQKIFAEVKFDVLALTGVGPALATGGYLDMSGYGNFGILVIDSVLGGTGLSQIEIVAAKDTSGTNVQQVVTKTITPSAAAVADFATLEIQADQVREVETAAALSPFTLRYVGARVTLNNAGDKVIIVNVRYKPKAPQSNLTADVIH